MVSLKCEKQQVAALAEYLAGLLAHLDMLVDLEGQRRLVERIKRRGLAALRHLVDDGTGPVVEAVLVRSALAGKPLHVHD